jgi:hypothetical protein
MRAPAPQPGTYGFAYHIDLSRQLDGLRESKVIVATCKIIVAPELTDRRFEKQLIWWLFQ